MMLLLMLLATYGVLPITIEFTLHRLSLVRQAALRHAVNGFGALQKRPCVVRWHSIRVINDQ